MYKFFLNSLNLILNLKILCHKLLFRPRHIYHWLRDIRTVVSRHQTDSSMLAAIDLEYNKEQFPRWCLLLEIALVTLTASAGNNSSIKQKTRILTSIYSLNLKKAEQLCPVSYTTLFLKSNNLNNLTKSSCKIHIKRVKNWRSIIWLKLW